METLLYLSEADVARCAPRAVDVAAAVHDAFAARARGRAHAAPNLHIRLSDRHFSAKAAVLQERDVAVVKWYGNVPANRGRALPDYQPLLLVNDLADGAPLAVLSGGWITAARTAAITTVAAGVLCDDAADTLALVGCGRQAAAHLDALAARYPLQRVSLYSRGSAGAQRLAAVARARGLEAVVTDDPRRAVADSRIVVSAISRDARDGRFLRTEWIDKGAFVSMVDLGLAWAPETFDCFDYLVTDEYDAATRNTCEPLAFQGPFDADLAALVAGGVSVGVRNRQRSALIFAGSGLADAAAAMAVYTRARERGVGTTLPR
jgi:ornithine cyclodeaminase/alanine dehydrogenase-like protein (mu-crystallin family)